MIVGLCHYHLGDIFFELVMVENPRFAVGISMPSLTVPETQEYFRFGRPYCCFRLSVVTRCRNHSRITNTVFAFAIVDNSRFAAEKNSFVFCRAMLASSATFAVMRYLSVRPCASVCVTFVHSVKTNKHIFNFFNVG